MFKIWMKKKPDPGSKPPLQAVGNVSKCLGRHYDEKIMLFVFIYLKHEFKSENPLIIDFGG